MSFWNLNDGSSAASGSEFEMGGGGFEPIPANTGLVAVIEEAKWDAYEDDQFISLKWRVAQPEEYGNRVIFQKLRVYNADPAKADRQKRMLAAIDANAGGKLVALGREPGDQDLMSALAGKMMAIKVQVWEMQSRETGEPMSGNWISAVSPAKGRATEAAKKVAPKAHPKSAPAEEEDDFGDDIPFN